MLFSNISIIKQSEGWSRKLEMCDTLVLLPDYSCKSRVRRPCLARKLMLADEKVLLDCIEEKIREKVFSPAQYSSFDTVLGRPINEYLNADW